ncbi:hypothetical protein QO207_24125 [Pseudomonas sp. CAN2814]|jgi:hypothetical protein|uniref:hypothetical protein n=1 Tax=Pseudomonas sp. CAN1 TaxID=3046726 RepID=UPI0026497B44|nr:hypothetical protein [Pseudomonas sp. CAN1]MDN6859685.1 hypothetical protein [Pseudomonas sp. CAN1]
MSESGSERWQLIPDDENPRKLLWNWEPTAKDDLDSLFHRIRNGTGTDVDHELFYASIIDRFITRVYAGEEVEQWVMDRLADAFSKVLMGGDWIDEIPLPGRPGNAIRPWRDDRDLQIFCDVSNSLNLENAAVVNAIQGAADKHAVSFETARAAYYRWKNSLGR